MHISYKVELKNTDGRIVKVENFTRFTEIATFHRADVELAHRICLDLTKSLAKEGTICLTTK